MVFGVVLGLNGCGTQDNGVADEKEVENSVPAKGETLSCQLAATSDQTIADGLTYESQPTCLSPCDTCIYDNDNHQNSCTETCDTDSDCDTGLKCVGCFTTFVCAKVCEDNGDCSADEQCQSGICLWAT